MGEEKLKKLMNELAERTTESVRPGLAEDIKHRIPQKLTPSHRIGTDTVNIIIDLRVSKLAAAAVIIATMILFAVFFGSRDSVGDGIYQDGKLLVKYCLGGENTDRSDILAGISKFYEYLLHKGKDVVYYGDSIDPDNSDALLLRWKLSEGKYKVIFGDLSAKTVTAEELIELQAQMLRKNTR